MDRITYLSREKPEEEIGVVFLVHSEEARMTANVFRDVPAFDRGQFAGFLYFASLDVWREEQSGAYVTFNGDRIPVDIGASQMIGRSMQFCRIGSRCPC